MNIDRYIQYVFSHDLEIVLSEFGSIPFPYLVPEETNDTRRLWRVVHANIPFFVCHFYCCAFYFYGLRGLEQQTETDRYPLPTGILAGAGSVFPPETVLLLATSHAELVGEDEATKVVAEVSRSICLRLLNKPGTLFSG